MITGDQRDFYYTSLSLLRSSPNLTDHYPRLAKPRLGLSYDRCFAACQRFNRFASPRSFLADYLLVNLLRQVNHSFERKSLADRSLGGMGQAFALRTVI